MADRLAVWLYGPSVATVGEERRRLRLEYCPEALDRFPGGTPLLSLALPLSNERFGNGNVRPFLDGLLPEGDPRRAIADDLRPPGRRHLRAHQGSRLGLCRGSGHPARDLYTAPGVAVHPNRRAPLTDDDLRRPGRQISASPHSAWTSRVRISLAGVQEKLLLTRMPDGRWGRPWRDAIDPHPQTRNQGVLMDR